MAGRKRRALRASRSWRTALYSAARRAARARSPNFSGMTVFRHACARGCEGIVSKPLGSHYRSGRVGYWLKIKNPAAPATKRDAEENWGTNDGGADEDERRFEPLDCLE